MGNLPSNFGTLGLWVLELFAMYATDAFPQNLAEMRRNLVDVTKKGTRRHQSNVGKKRRPFSATARDINQIWQLKKQTVIMTESAKFTHDENTRWRRPPYWILTNDYTTGNDCKMAFNLRVVESVSDYNF